MGLFAASMGDLLSRAAILTSDIPSHKRTRYLVFMILSLFINKVKCELKFQNEITHISITYKKRFVKLYCAQFGSVLGVFLGKNEKMQKNQEKGLQNEIVCDIIQKRCAYVPVGI